MGADCKSAGVRLRGFESLPAHKEVGRGAMQEQFLRARLERTHG